MMQFQDPFERMSGAALLLAGFMMCSMFLAAGPAEGNDQARRMVRPDPAYGFWFSGTPYQFRPVPRDPRQNSIKGIESLDGTGNEAADGEEPGRERSQDRRKPGGMTGPGQLLERIPSVQSVLAVREKVMDRLSPTLDNPDGRLFFPVFKSGEAEPRDAGRERPASGEQQGSSRDGRKEGQSSQERYFVGYRLGSKARQVRETWYLGLGWKGGGGEGHGRKPPKGMGDDGGIKDDRASEGKDSSTNAVKVEYSGPVVGVVGRF